MKATELRGGSPLRITVVLPIYNEADNLEQLLSDLAETFCRLRYRIVAVDDGSNDRSLEVLERASKRLPIEILRHETNLGLGSTIRDGLYRAARTSEPDEVIVTMDADASHTPSTILKMLGGAAAHDVVIASRFTPASRSLGVPFHRRLLSVGASMLFRVLFPTRGVRDFTCGYRAYRAEILRKAIESYGDKFIQADGFQCMVDVLLKLRALNARFLEIPFELRYDRKKGKSKMKVFRTAALTLALAVRWKLGLRRPFEA